MPVDVQTEITIRRPRAEVAAYAADPDNATAWYEKIKGVEWKTERPLTTGTKITFAASFLGRQLSYTYAITDHAPGERIVMRTAQGPFPMETIYTWQDAADGATKMTLRNRGEPTGFAKLTTPMLAAAMRRANRSDLKRLKDILERQA